ncbi:hypothetical protein GCK72_024281 [Caenorhabditis remanei]|uniref:Uncharacterized protein n=1 Tax=Caenorhabditis remanei TaxID=31234 RepID=A0A6A5FZD6_CAERE|nr:hypothetical protein GCK72_024281 [Caenorhabditis remanei]KAF1747815.1 hypothetical protein GCK72_024281 [Caenorhabditis remanei]
MWANSRCAYLLMPLLILLLINLSESVSVHRRAHKQTSNGRHPTESVFRAKRTYIDENANCGIHEMEMVHTIMDRICMLCHELHSHFAPNTRVECRKDCFQNTTFQSCMRIFSGGPKPVQPVEPTAPVPLYTEDVPTLDDIKERRRRI